MIESNVTQVVLYTEQSFLAEGLASAFSSKAGLRLAASHNRIAETIAFVRDHAADILLLEVTQEITIPTLHALQRTNPSGRTALWTGAICPEFARQAAEAGVRGILPKSLSSDEFMAALEVLREGGFCFDKEVLESLISARPVALTMREGQLVDLLCQGLKNKEIAYTLQIREGTVKVYLSRLFRKLGVKDRFELALYGLKNRQFGYEIQFNNRISPGIHGQSNPPGLRSILVAGSQSGTPDASVVHGHPFNRTC